jgi:hypothetical protein
METDMMWKTGLPPFSGSMHIPVKKENRLYCKNYVNERGF